MIFEDNFGSNVTRSNDQEGVRRSSRIKQTPIHLQDYDLLHDFVVSS